MKQDTGAGFYAGVGRNFQPSVQFDLVTGLRLLREHVVGIVVLALMVAALTAVVVYRMPSEYRATTTVLVEPDKKDQIGLDAVFDSGRLSSQYLETQRYIFYSRTLLAAAVEGAKLYEYAEYQVPRQKKWWQGDLRRHLPGLSGSEPELVYDVEADKRYAVAKLLAGVHVVVAARTQMLRVSVTSENPKLAALAANHMVQAYIASGLESRLTKTKSANAWLGGRLEEMKSSLAASEKKLQDFLSNNELIDVGGVRSLVEKDITQNTANLLAARKTVAELTAVVSKIRAANNNWEKLSKIEAVVVNKLVQDTRTEYLATREKLAAIAGRYGVKHPKRISAETIHRESKASYVAQVNAAANTILSNFDLAKQRVKDLGDFTEENRNELQVLDRKSYELKVLEREVDANRKLYDLFLSKLKETDLSDDFQTVNAVVLDEAVPPGRPAAPRRKLIIVASFVLTIGFLFGLAVLRLLLDKRIRDPDQLAEKIPGSILLGSIPKEKALRKGNEKSLRKAISKSPEYSEAIQGLRTALFLSEPDRPNQVIMLSSAVSGEGKTTVSISLAVSLGRVAKTLIIEADMRRPKFRTLLGKTVGENGLSQVLVGSCSLDEAVQRIDELGVDCLAAGAIPPNPLELLGSESFTALLADLRTKYDRIVIDCPPIEPVSDTLLIASRADAIVYLLRADSTSSVVASKSIEAVHEAGGRIVGVALNALDTGRLGKYYGDRFAGYGPSAYHQALGAKE